MRKRGSNGVASDNGHHHTQPTSSGRYSPSSSSQESEQEDDSRLLHHTQTRPSSSSTRSILPSLIILLITFLLGLLSMYLYLHFTQHHLITRRFRHSQFLQKYETFLKREGVNVRKVLLGEDFTDLASGPSSWNRGAKKGKKKGKKRQHVDASTTLDQRDISSPTQWLQSLVEKTIHFTEEWCSDFSVRAMVDSMLRSWRWLFSASSSTGSLTSSKKNQLKYDLVHAGHIKDLDLSMYEFRHVKSGMTVIWLHEDDPHLEVDNKFMSLAFRTPAVDHTGLTHILEHLALSGSDSYPIRDPFFSMVKRSLQTYMNAWTISDHTQYVFSTQNEEDFWNLMRVYLDSAFKPLLRKLDFSQEGYRIGEHGYEGIVYNEMAGSLSDPIYYIAMAVNWIMYSYERNPFHRKFIPLRERYINQTHNNYRPNFASYRWNSGGDPHVMTSLEYEDLVNYHKTFYHPSNALAFIYGGNLARSLKMIDQYANVEAKVPDVEEFIRNMKHKREQQEMFPEAAANESTDENASDSAESSSRPVYMTPHQEAEMLYNIREKKDDYHIYVSCPPDLTAKDPERQTKLIIAFQTNQATNIFESFTLALIAEILFHNPRGPLYKSLIRSGMAQDFTFSGFEAGELLRKHTLFTIGVTGIAESEVRHIEETIFDTLYNVTRDGISHEHVEAILNQMELGWKEVSADFGKRLALRVVPAWVNNASPHNSLRISHWIRRMRAKIFSGSNYLPNKIRHHFLDNRYRETIVLTPDPDFATKLRKYEERKFEFHQKTRTEQEKKALEEERQKLTEHQSRDMYDISILPTLSDKDIHPEIQFNLSTHLQKENMDGIPLIFNQEHTNGIVYINLKATLDLDELMRKVDLTTILPLLTRILPKIGTRSKHFLQLSEEIDLYTGGLSTGTNIISNVHSHNLKELGVSMASTALNGNQEKQIELMGQVWFNATFGNHEYLKSLLLEYSSQAQESLLQQGHNYAAAIAGASLIEVGKVHEMFHGYHFVEHMSMLFDRYNIENLLLQLKRVYTYIHQPVNYQIYVTCEPSQVADVRSNVEKLIPHLKNSLYVPESKKRETFVPESKKTYVALPISVNYVSRVILIPPPTHKDYAYLRIVSNLMQMYLHGEIREKGGAYGAFAEVLESGVFVMKTYRDPRVIETFQAFEFSINQVCEGNFNRVDLREAKLRTFQQIDRPMTPHEKGLRHFLNADIDDDYRQTMRLRMLSTTSEDAIRVCQQYLKDEIQHQSLAVIGPADSIPQEIQDNSEWRVVRSGEYTKQE